MGVIGMDFVVGVGEEMEGWMKNRGGEGDWEC